MPTTTADRVRESATATIGTGNVTLAGAASGFRAFYATFSTGSFYYTIVVGTQWEVGIGHCTNATTLVRDTLLSSSTGSAINFSAGTADVFATAPGAFFNSSPANMQATALCF